MHRVAIIAVFAAVCGGVALAAAVAAGGGAVAAASALSLLAGAAAVVLPQIVALAIARREAVFSPYGYWARKFLLTMAAFLLALHVLREGALLSPAALMLGVAAGLAVNLILAAREGKNAPAAVAVSTGEKK